VAVAAESAAGAVVVVAVEEGEEYLKHCRREGVANPFHLLRYSNKYSTVDRRRLLFCLTCIAPVGCCVVCIY
jgi:hypothetical protein